MMKLHEVLKEERLRREMTQQQLARMVGVHRSTLACYETGTASIPKDVICRAIRALRSSRLQAQTCFECSANLMTMPWLDRIDHHPVTVRDKVVIELREAALALEALDLINKLDSTHLTDSDYSHLDAAAEQLADLYAAIHTLFGCWQERYGFDPDKAARREYEKLFSKGYASRQKYDEAVLVLA